MLGGAWVPSFAFPARLNCLSVLVRTRWAVDGLDAMPSRELPLAGALLPAAGLAARRIDRDRS
jgi:ABC-2 type transport system permease protein